MEWITIEQAKEKYGKSETTIRAISRRLKGSKSKNIRIDKSTNGKEKILLNVKFLDSHFKVSTDRKNVSSNEVSSNDDNLIKMIAILENQLREKDKQIDNLIQGQYELLQSLGKASEVKQIDNGKTKRKWYKLWLR
jgi:hypothetical protein